MEDDHSAYSEDWSEGEAEEEAAPPDAKKEEPKPVSVICTFSGWKLLCLFIPCRTLV